jgi:hypothetical protein
MIEVSLIIEEICELPLFQIDAPKDLIPEIEQAIEGEKTYNNSKLDFGGLIYEFERNKNGKQ